MDNLDEIKQAFLQLSRLEKEDFITFTLGNIPPGVKLRDLAPSGSKIAPFDLDLVSGQVGEIAFLNIATSGKHEIKRDFKISETDNIAVEVECSGKPSGLEITEAPYWVYWLSGNEYQDEVAVIITVARLKKIAKTCHLHNGGDSQRSWFYLIPKQKLLAKNSEIEKWKPRPPGHQLDFFG